MKQFITRNIDFCKRQMHVDNVLTLLSAAVTTVFLVMSFEAYLAWLIPLLIVGWIVHLLVMFYCRLLWTARRRKWEALFRWYDLIESIPGVMDARDDLGSPLLRLGSR